MLVETGEQAGQIVEIGAHDVRRSFTGHNGQRLFELQQARGQLRFTRFGNDHRRRSQRLLVNFRFTEDGQHAGIGILHIRRGVAFERQHVIPVKYVVGGAVFGQIGILHCANTDRIGQLFQLSGRHVRILLGHQAARALQRFIQQIRQLHGTPGASFERLTIFAQHHAEHVMFQRHGFRHIARFTHDRPRLHQVLVLTGIDVVEHPVGVQRFITILRTGDIGRGVEVAAILFLDDDAHRFAFLVFILIKEHHGCAFALDGQTFSFQIGNNAWQHRVIQAFTHYVIAGQGDVQTIVGNLVLGHGDVNQLAPHLQEVSIATLQFYYVVTGAFGKDFIFVIMLFGIAVEAFEIGQRHFTGVFLLLFFQPGDQHTELSAPVAHVVRADHLMTEELKRTDGSVTDDGGTQMADVHLFGDIRRGVVNDDSLRLRPGDAQTL